MAPGGRRARNHLASFALLGAPVLWVLISRPHIQDHSAIAWLSQVPRPTRNTRQLLHVTDVDTAEAPLYPPPREGFAWKDLGFGLTTTDTQITIAKCPRGGEWGPVRVQPYGPLQMDPAATILNYGQGLFEGMKAFRTKQGRIVLFRPKMNAQRMANGARRLLMPPVPEELFLEAVSKVVLANGHWVPPAGEGELYLRPLLIGSGGTLGVGPSTEFTFLIYGAPVGKYFSGGGAKLRIEADHQRAAPKGVGDVKMPGNYAPCFEAQKEAREADFSDVLYVDVGGTYIEEAAASNFFALGEDGVLRTPSLGTILPGVTRASIMFLAEKLSSEGGPIKGVEEGQVTLEHVLSAKEAFVTGTGAGVTPVASITLPDGTTAEYATPGPATELLQETMQKIKLEEGPDEFGWLWDPTEVSQ